MKGNSVVEWMIRKDPTWQEKDEVTRCTAEDTRHASELGKQADDKAEAQPTD